MSKFLLDTNLSPRTREYLEEKFGFDIIDLHTEGKHKLSDKKVISLAKKEKRIIITFDLDFGEIYYFNERGKVGIIVLRLKNQTVESVNKTLSRFFTKGAENIKLQTNLVIVEENKVRIIGGIS